MVLHACRSTPRSAATLAAAAAAEELLAAVRTAGRCCRRDCRGASGRCARGARKAAAGAAGPRCAAQTERVELAARLILKVPPPMPLGCHRARSGRLCLQVGRMESTRAKARRTDAPMLQIYSAVRSAQGGEQIACRPVVPRRARCLRSARHPIAVRSFFQLTHKACSRYQGQCIPHHTSRRFCTAAARPFAGAQVRRRALAAPHRSPQPPAPRPTRFLNSSWYTLADLSRPMDLVPLHQG